MKRTLIICAMFFFYSCSSNIRIPGKYTSNENPDFLQLNNDSTFLYRYNAYHVSEYSSGKWSQINDRTVILNSEVQSKIMRLIVEDTTLESKGKNNLFIKFTNEVEAVNYKCATFINDTLYTLKSLNQLVSTGLSLENFSKEINVNDIYFRYIRCDSLSSVKVSNPIKNIFFKIIKSPIDITTNKVIRYPLETERFIVNSNSKNTLQIQASVEDSLFNYRVFKNEKLKISRKGVSIFNNNNNKWWYIPRLLDTYSVIK